MMNRTNATLGFVLLMFSVCAAAATTYAYDSLNRLVEVTYDSGWKQAYSYDAGGNRLSMTITPPAAGSTTTGSTTTTSAIGTSTTTVATTTSTTQTGSGFTMNLVAGWNLIGNGWDATVDVGTVFSDANSFTTIWKWISAQSAWAFYAPSLAAQGGTALADYAASKGYQLLTTIAGGDGFWVNAKQAANVNLSGGNAISAAGLGAKLAPGWNLMSIAEATTPKQFCDAQSGGVTTLWAWDATANAWYFYAPSLDASGGLAAYIASKGYLDFATANKMLGQGVGFWVNKP